jgi:hypothetical protein
MKKVLLTMTAVGAIAAAAPALAQNVNAGGTVGIDNQIDRLDDRLQAGISSGEITRQEARSLRTQLNELNRLQGQYSAGGLTQQERSDLRQRIRSLRAELRTADGGTYDRFENGSDWADNDVNGDVYSAADFGTRMGQLQTRLDAGIRSREISSSEASSLRMQLSQLTTLERQYQRGGFTAAEQSDLQRRLLSTRQQMRTADRGTYDRYENSSDWAQYGTNGDVYGAADFGTRLGQLQTRLDAGIRSREISSSEASSLRMQLSQLATLERQYARNGFTAAEQSDLQRRISSTRQEMRIADRGRYDSYERAGDWSEYDDDYATTAVGGPYEEVECQSRGGLGNVGSIGGILQTVLGGAATSDCGLRVGQRAPDNLSAVPYEYRDQFRDGNGIYYRTDGRSIYQIDSRTNNVLRVYSANR